jgi:hypothetical protein
MANRWFGQELNNLVKGLTLLEGHVTIGGSGATSALQGSGIASVTRMAAGVYKCVLSDPYNRFLGLQASVSSVVDTPADLDTVTNGNIYVITTVGDATAAQWVASGVPAAVTPAVGVVFVGITASVSGTTSKVAALLTAANQGIEIAGDPNASINQSASPHFYFRTMGATAAGDTTLVPADPASGSKLHFAVLLRVSSVKGSGE